MSDEDRDVDIESDAEKRAHHNALERKRRDHIKESFNSLRDSVPTLQVEKVTVSRAQILKKAADYIQFMRTKNLGHQKDIEDLKKQNTYLEKQIRALEKAKNTGSYTTIRTVRSPTQVAAYTNDSGSESDGVDAPSTHGRRKRLKTANCTM
ncbi:protein max [Octopus bimaculoides]|uniref:Protein max n=1 Tax=Octopus bimaculoides TaxID=37653 RepID=A0A0L8H8P6_OCTBM|nr:protein max [Octopus bimaculoides]|eukprot:XP_014774612.1 PREDICTED: protein max-like [Octopus bimaculoides]